MIRTKNSTNDSVEQKKKVKQRGASLIKRGRPKRKSLTAQHKIFCRLWVQKFNLADAWLEAGYKCKSRDTAKANAWEFLHTNPYAEKYIDKLLKEQQKRLDKTADDAMRELIKIGFSNIQDYIGEGNTIVDLSQIPQDKAVAIESVQTDIRHDSGDSKGYTEKVRLKIHDKLSALKELLDRWQGKPPQKLKVNGVIGTRVLSDEEVAKALQDRIIPCEDAIAK